MISQTGDNGERGRTSLSSMRFIMKTNPSHLPLLLLLPLVSANTVSGNEAQLGAVLEKDVAGRLRRGDADAVVGDDGRRLGRDMELEGGGEGRASVSISGRGKRQGEGRRTSSAANLRTAVKGASSGTLTLCARGTGRQSMCSGDVLEQSGRRTREREALGPTSA